MTGRDAAETPPERLPEPQYSHQRMAYLTALSSGSDQDQHWRMRGGGITARDEDRLHRWACDHRLLASRSWHTTVLSRRGQTLLESWQDRG